MILHIAGHTSVSFVLQTGVVATLPLPLYLFYVSRSSTLMELDLAMLQYVQSNPAITDEQTQSETDSLDQVVTDWREVSIPLALNQP